MPLLKTLRVVFVCAALQLGVFCGVPMRPEEIQELMATMNRPSLAHVLKEEADAGDK